MKDFSGCLILIGLILMGLIISYPMVFVAIFVCIVLFVIVHAMNKNAEKQAQIIENKHKEEMNKLTVENKIKEEQEQKKKKQEAFDQAVRLNKDVCLTCETILPKRCTNCNKCISCWSNYSSHYRDLCSTCGRELARKKCLIAEKKGKDVCWTCLRIEPGRCSCGNCLYCSGDAGGECQACSD